MEGVDAVFAVHCDPSLDVGQVGLREGPLTAACDHIACAAPRPRRSHLATAADRGPHLRLAKVVTDVPAALSRRLDPRAGAALVWGTVQAGKAANVIPSSGECSGTCACSTPMPGSRSGRSSRRSSTAVVAPYGVEAKLERVKGVPPVVNTRSTPSKRCAWLPAPAGMVPVPDHAVARR
jgi:metal-dependent amidase/aminoacylase/carboxypeptidase family protein